MLKVNKNDFTIDTRVRLVKVVDNVYLYNYDEDKSIDIFGINREAFIECINYINDLLYNNLGEELEILRFQKGYTRKYGGPHVLFKIRGLRLVDNNDNEMAFHAFWTDFKRMVELI